jgi:D-xylose transport system ATP-binding protein
MGTTVVDVGNGEPIVLEACGISKAFGHVQALANVSFELRKGEVVALLGDNGAGKSTLVKILAGVQKPDEGQLLRNGSVITLRDPIDALHHGIAAVYQELAVVDTLDVARNIYLGDPPRRFRFFLDHRTMVARSQKVLSSLRVDLPSVRTKVGDLSGGQRQAVAIARALAQHARLMLLDEPTAALGVAQTEKVNQLIADLKSEGRTVLLITHNLHHVFEVADRMIVLRHGRLVGERDKAASSPEEIVGLITGAIVGDVRA